MINCIKSFVQILPPPHSTGSYQEDPWGLILNLQGYSRPYRDIFAILR